jgi:ribosomal protein S18 acetylase RimI-like enzyme
VKIRAFQASDESSVILLWKACDLLRPWNDPGKDIRRKLRVQPEMFIVGHLNEQLIATAMAGYEGHRGWINYLAVAPSQRGRGYGRAIMAVQVRGQNAAAMTFYQRLGYRIDDTVSLGKRIEHDDEA